MLVKLRREHLESFQALTEEQLAQFLREQRRQEMEGEQSYGRGFLKSFPKADRSAYDAALKQVTSFNIAYGLVSDILPDAILAHAVEGNELFSPAAIEGLEQRFHAVQTTAPAPKSTDPGELLRLYAHAERGYRQIGRHASTMYLELEKLNNVTNPAVTHVRLSLSGTPVAMRALADTMAAVAAPYRKRIDDAAREARTAVQMQGIASEYPETRERIARLGYAV